MEIKKATLDDYNIIYDIAHRTWYRTYTSILSAEQLEYMLDMMYSREAITEQIDIKGHRFLLVSDEGVTIGFASYEMNHQTDTTRLHKLYILPDIQGKGAGRLLMAAVEEAARQGGNSSVVLNVNRYNPAYQFYLKCGYKKVGEEDIDIGRGYFMEDYIMGKTLKSL